MTERHPAIHTPGSLSATLIIREKNFYLAVIVDPLFHRSIPGNLAPYL
jgi:hypothetical protein